jgi:tRNA-specific 2-thiouridylase
MVTERIIVGISGGVDSSVAALLLQRQGRDVEALFMKNWQEPDVDGTCPWEADVEDAMRVCEQLDIPLNTVDLSRQYRDGVFAHFLEEYRLGRTPNPDVLCNQEVKFRAFLDLARGRGAALIATGHYARLEQTVDGLRLLKGRDRGKDQSYFLSRLDQDQLRHALFPVGGLVKNEVRAIAREAGLATSGKKDSTGICFIGPRHFREFLARFLPVQRGPIVDPEGRTIGEHDGTHFYTIGQRQGLGIGGRAGRSGEPWYVVDRDPRTNVLIAAQGRDHPLLYSSEISCRSLHWIGPGDAPEPPFQCRASTRYRQPDQACRIEEIEGDRVTVRFAEPQHAVAPGQYLVFYDGDACLGSAVMESARR